MPFPALSSSLRQWFDDNVLGWWDWYTDVRTFVDTKFSTLQDVTLLTPGKGIHMISPTGVKYYVTIDDAGVLISTPE